MGGHGHGHGLPYTIPNADVYKAENVKELVALRERLAKKGLKDPWSRNEVWRFNPPPTGFLGKLQHFNSFLRGARLGIPAFLITIAVEHYFEVDYTGHGGHHGHNNGEHH